MFTCPQGHKNAELAPFDTAEAWYECLRCGHRAWTADYLCPDCKCGAPAKAHPSAVDLLLGKNDTEHAHVADGQKCKHPVAMRKRVGFLCAECGDEIEGLLTKQYE